jgi:hypothetical protein
MWSVDMKERLVFACLFLVVSACIVLPASSHANEMADLSQGQTLYVPAYSHIYSGNREFPHMLAVTLSIRNIDPKRPIRITKVDYYETQGNLVKRYLKTPLTLKPLESQRYVIPEKDKAGGSGANFIVEWESGSKVNPPIVECVMIGAKGQQGISFTSRARVLQPSD